MIPSFCILVLQNFVITTKPIIKNITNSVLFLFMEETNRMMWSYGVLINQRRGAANDIELVPLASHIAA